MDVHIARQPIFDIHNKLFAYELLFRQTLGLHLGDMSGDRVTTSLLSTTFLTEGVEKIAGNKPCFINFTKNLLVKEIAASFPKNKIISRSSRMLHLPPMYWPPAASCPNRATSSPWMILSIQKSCCR